MSVLSVSLSPTHSFTKPSLPSITLIEGHGIEGDCHAGPTVQHRSRLHLKPPPPNLRQVHLIPSEVFQQVSRDGEAEILPGQLGENVTTAGVDLLKLGQGTKLHFVEEGQGTTTESGGHAVVVVQGLRNPCPQIDTFRKGLREKFMVRDEKRRVVERLAGVMSTVESGGVVKPGMVIRIEEPQVYKPLDVV